MTSDETTSQAPEHTPAVRERLHRVEGHKDRVLHAGLAMAKADGGKFFPLDFLAWGALKRSIGTTAAFVQLVEAWNMVATRTMLRVHLDTALRFSAAWLVDDPHAFARAVLKGERIDRMKDRAGHLLTDKFLVGYHAPKNPWLPDVYRHLSGYVHLSGAHIASPLQTLGGNETGIEVSAEDHHLPERSWVEVLDCFLEASDLFMHYIDGWIQTKNLPPEVLRRMKEARR